MKYLLLIGQNYSFEILRPLQEAALQRGDQLLWFVYRSSVNTRQFQQDEHYTTDIKPAIEFNPDACFAPGNIAPSFIPGYKVQVFHGFEWKKKGHFRIRDCFDLYCTQGKLFTDKFAKLAKKHGNFDVVETGWPKMDRLFKSHSQSQHQPTIIYAPTFSPSLCSAPKLINKIEELSKKHDWHWKVKFHPKMSEELVTAFKNIEHDKLSVVETNELGPLLHSADVMLSDTSSIITEFMLLDKPVVTFNNLEPEPCLLNILDVNELEPALERALAPDSELKEAIKLQNKLMHPYKDGKSSERILDATEHLILRGKKSKPLPLNLFRNLKMRKKFGFWGI